MTISGNQLLAALGSGIIPNEGKAAPNEKKTPLNFDDVLARVQRGEPSQLSIEIGKQLNTHELSDDLKSHAARAADLGAIHGVSQALVETEGSILRLDVPNRIVEAQIEPQQELVIDQIDGYIALKPTKSDSADEQSTQSGLPPNHQFSPARGVRNSSLAQVLARQER